MLTLRLTQKLAASLRVPLQKDAAPATNPCADWCCHKFTANRCRYFLVTNASTFYSVVLRAQGMGSRSAFIDGIIACLRSYLEGAGHLFVFTQLIAPASTEVQFVPVSDRRILGVMNDYIYMSKFYLEDLSPAQTSDRLNECPTGPLGMMHPSEVFPPGTVTQPNRTSIRVGRPPMKADDQQTAETAALQAIEIKVLRRGDDVVLRNVATGVFDNPIDPKLAREFLEDPRHHIAVAVDNGLVVGFASGVHYIHPDKPPELWINEVGIAPTHRRRGLGKAVLKALFDAARELNCTTAWVLTDGGNPAAMKLYSSIGGTLTVEDAAPGNHTLMYSFVLS